MSKREDILDNVETVLKTITLANSYNNDIGKVSRDISNWTNIQAKDFPFAIIYWKGNALEGTGATNQYIDSDFTVTIGGGISSKHEAVQELNDFLEDIEKAMCNNSSTVLGDNTGYVVPQSIEPFYSERTEMITFEFDFTVNYWYVYATP